MNDKTNNQEPTTTEGLENLRNKVDELKKKNIIPPVDEDEPSGLLSGGPEHLDLEDDD